MFYLGCNLRPENDIYIATAALIVHVKKKNHDSSDILVVCLCIQSLWQEEMLL